MYHITADNLKNALEVATVQYAACCIVACRESSVRCLGRLVLGIVFHPCRRNKFIPHTRKGKPCCLRHMDNGAEHHPWHQTDHTAYSSCHTSALVLITHNLGNISYSSTHSLTEDNANRNVLH